MNLKFGIALAAALIGLSSYARADFVGQQVTVLYDFPSIGTVDQHLGTQTITAAGNNFTSYEGIFTTKVSGGAVEFDYDEAIPSWNSAASFNGLVIEEAGSGPAISGVTLSTSGMSGLSASDLSFDSHDIYLNWAGASATATAQVQIGVQFSDAAAAPLPATALAGLALLGGLGAVALRSRRSTIAR